MSGHRRLTGSDVTVTCRVLMVNPQPYSRRIAFPVTDAELAQAYLVSALSGQRPLRSPGRGSGLFIATWSRARVAASE